MMHCPLLFLAILSAQTAIAQSPDVSPTPEVPTRTESPLSEHSIEGDTLLRKLKNPLRHLNPGQHYILQSGEYFTFGDTNHPSGALQSGKSAPRTRQTNPDSAVYNGIPLKVLLDQMQKFNTEPKEFKLPKYVLENTDIQMKRPLNTDK